MAYSSPPFDCCLQVLKGMEGSVATTQLAPGFSFVATVSLLIKLMLVTLQYCGRATFCLVVLAGVGCCSKINFALGLWIQNWLFLMLRCYAVTCFLGHSALCNVHFWLCKTLMLWFRAFKSMGLGMILRNHTYLEVHKCCQILPILKTSTIKWLVIFFKIYFNFEGFYMVYIIIWRFLGSKNFTPSKLGKLGLQKMLNGESFLGEKHGKIAHWAKLHP